jgi:glutamyl-tRNA synthetase
MLDNKKEIRVRFAPSPTGHLHMGGVRVAIFNWLFAKHNGGKYLLRIEDTDVLRSKKEYEESIIDSLKWLDLLPDEPIVYQMSRLDEHKKIIKNLLDKKMAYPCFCDPAKLEQKREELFALGITPKYAGTCKDKSYTQEDLQKPHAIRFKVPDDIQFVEFEDAIRGKIRVEKDQLDDFVILRQDGVPIYNFVVVVDDIFMKITHVVRGEDHISNTPKQILLYRALGAQHPVFAHLPMILGPSGQRLSKRDAAVDVQEYKKQGFLADAFFNYLVRLGWAHGDQEIFTKEEMIKFFSLEHVGKKGAVFDIKKLEWLNGVYIRNSTFEKLFNAVEDLSNNYQKELQELWTTEQLKELFAQYAQRATKLLDMVLNVISLAKAPIVLDLKLIEKWLHNNSAELISSFVKEVQSSEKLSHEQLAECAKNICEKFGLKLVDLAQPLRLALTGKIVSPGVFELIKILGKDESVKRINFLLKQIEQKKNS